MISTPKRKIGSVFGVIILMVLLLVVGLLVYQSHLVGKFLLESLRVTAKEDINWWQEVLIIVAALWMIMLAIFWILFPWLVVRSLWRIEEKLEALDLKLSHYPSLKD